MLPATPWTRNAATAAADPARHGCRFCRTPLTVSSVPTKSRVVSSAGKVPRADVSAKPASSSSLAAVPTSRYLTFFAIATYTCLDVVTAESYSTDLRASAVGWGLGISRLGGAAGPVIGGYLISKGISYAAFFLVFAILPIINIALSTGLRFASSRPQLAN